MALSLFSLPMELITLILREFYPDYFFTNAKKKNSRKEKDKETLKNLVLVGSSASSPFHEVCLDALYYDVLCFVRNIQRLTEGLTTCNGARIRKLTVIGNSEQIPIVDSLLQSIIPKVPHLVCFNWTFGEIMPRNIYNILRKHTCITELSTHLPTDADWLLGFKTMRKLTLRETYTWRDDKTKRFASLLKILQSMPELEYLDITDCHVLFKDELLATLGIHCSNLCSLEIQAETQFTPQGYLGLFHSKESKLKYLSISDISMPVNIFVKVCPFMSELRSFTVDVVPYGVDLSVGDALVKYLSSANGLKQFCLNTWAYDESPRPLLRALASKPGRPIKRLFFTENLHLSSADLLYLLRNCPMLEAIHCSTGVTEELPGIFGMCPELRIIRILHTGNYDMESHDTLLALAIQTRSRCKKLCSLTLTPTANNKRYQRFSFANERDLFKHVEDSFGHGIDFCVSSSSAKSSYYVIGTNIITTARNPKRRPHHLFY